MVQRHGESDKDDLNTWEKGIIEKTHIFLCKQSLGVNEQCRNVAARNELGRLSLNLTIPHYFKILDSQTKLARWLYHKTVFTTFNGYGWAKQAKHITKGKNVNVINIDHPMSLQICQKPWSTINSPFLPRTEN